MFTPYIVAMKLSILKHLLMIVLSLEPFCVSQMLIYTMDMSNFGETLITLGLEAKMILLKM